MSEDTEYKESPDVLEKSDAEYKLEEALREVERLQNNALGTLEVYTNEDIIELLDPVTSLCAYTAGLKAELERLQDKIRWHRDQWLSGDNKCWKDNEELYKLLPEGYTPPERDTLCEFENCKRYIESCHDPRVKYVSPQVRIEELEKQLLEVKLRAELAERILEVNKVTHF